MATYGLLHPKHIFGINAGCRGRNLFSTDENVILYPAGNTIVLYNIDQKTQQFLHGVEKVKGITAFTVSSNKAYAAVAQLGDQKPTISIFDLKVNKRKKTISNNDVLSREYVSLAFNSDFTNITALSGQPEFGIYLWKWDKARLLCQGKTTSSFGPMYEITTSPIDQAVICAVGKGTLKFFRHSEGHLKPFGYQKGENSHFLCQVWLGKGDRMIAGTSEGRLLYFERAEYRFEVKIPSFEHTRKDNDPLKEKEKGPGGELPEGFNVRIEDLVGLTTGAKVKVERSDSSRVSSEYEGKEVTAAVAFSKGFAIAFGAGNVVVYEEQLTYDTPEDHYKPIHLIRIPIFSTESNDRAVKSLVLNSTEEIIIATTISCQLFEFVLASAEIKDPNDMVFEFLSSSFHYGAIVALDVSVRKSLFVTIGADKFIRIWNYLTLSMEASKEFEEDMYSISFHPTGLFLLVGCTDKVRIFTILMNDIKELRDFNIRCCRVCAFSNGGHLFALTTSNTILIYSSTSYEVIFTLKGHNNKIRSLKWAQDDTKLVSVGADGAIYEWDVITGHRESDYVVRGSNMIDVAVSPDAKTFFAVSGNKFVKEIQMPDGILLKELDLGIAPTCITITGTGKALLAGMDDGVVRSFRQPLTYSNEWFDFRMHHDTINGIKITIEEAHCISVSEDGSIAVWKLTDAEGRVSKLEKDIIFANEVLIQKSELEERDLVMKELKQKFGEMRLEMEYQTKRKEITYMEEVKDLRQQFEDEINSKNAQIEELITTKEGTDKEYYANIVQLAKQSKENITNMEEHYNAQLFSEFEKYGELQNLLEETVRDYEGRLFKLDADRASAIEELMDYFQAKVKDKSAELQDAYKDSLESNQENEEIKRLLEENIEEELIQLTHNGERRLKLEKDLNAKLKAESNMMKKTYATMQKEIDDQKSEVLRLIAEAEKMKTVIGLTDKEVSTLKKDLVDRDVNLQGKEKIIIDLKKTNNELEKFKFVLDYKIKELKKMIEPKERDIIYLKQQNQDMQNELDQTVGARNGLELQVNELTNKLRVTDHELKNETKLRYRLQWLVGRIRSNLSRCMEILDDHRALKELIKSMYSKYGHTLKVGRATNAEQETICDLVRQKNHLELCLTSMKKKMGKDVEFTRNEQLKIMHENMLLVYEINNLRRELKLARDRYESYQSAFGELTTGKLDQNEMKLKLYNAVTDREELASEHNKELEAKDNMIEAQQFEIDSLTTRILKVQDFVNDVRSDTAPNASVDFLRQILSDNNN